MLIGGYKINMAHNSNMHTLKCPCHEIKNIVNQKGNYHLSTLHPLKWGKKFSEKHFLRWYFNNLARPLSGKECQLMYCEFPFIQLKCSSKLQLWGICHHQDLNLPFFGFFHLVLMHFFL